MVEANDKSSTPNKFGKDRGRRQRETDFNIKEFKSFVENFQNNTYPTT